MSKNQYVVTLLILLISLASPSVLAQPSRLDSLIHKLSDCQTSKGLDTAAFLTAMTYLNNSRITRKEMPRIDSVAATFDSELSYRIFYSVLWSLVTTDTDKDYAIDYGKKKIQLLEKSKSLHSTLIKDNFLTVLRVAYRTSPRLTEGIFYYNEKINEYKSDKDSTTLAACHFVLGGFYRVTGLLDQSIYHVKKALNYANRNDTTSFVGLYGPGGRMWWVNNMGNLGELLLLKGDYKQSINYSMMAFRNAPKTTRSYSYETKNIALAKLLSGQSDSVTYFLRAGFTNATERKAYSTLPIILQVEALYKLKLGDLGQAEKLIQQAWQLIHQYQIPANTPNGVAAPDYYLALVRIRQNRLGEAIQLLINDISRLDNQRLDVMRDYKLLAEVYAKAGIPERATQTYQTFVHLQDSLLTDQNKYRTVSFEIEQQMTDKDQSITKLQNDKAIVSIYRNFTIGIAVLLLLLAATLYYRFVAKQRANAALEHTLTELRTTQAQLIQREKLASLGELTAGIAHEIQNPLNFVNNFSGVSTELIAELQENALAGKINEVMPLANDLSSNLQKIHHHGERASRIVQGMLEHARNESGKKRPTNLNTLSGEYLQIAYHGQRAKEKTFQCELVTNFDSTLEQVEVAPQEIVRVLLNLYNNAFYSVSERIKQNNDTTYRPTVEVSTKRQTNQVMIRVSDNGTGIPNSVKPKLFQPFFTTKPTGEGTGLGLSLSYDIVTKGHGGTLTVESQQGQGAEFIVSLPIK